MSKRIRLAVLLFLVCASGHAQVLTASPGVGEHLVVDLLSSLTASEGVSLEPELTLEPPHDVQIADGQTGVDVGAKINAAFAACGGTASVPVQACTVTLAGTAPYSYATTIVIPNSTSAPFIHAPALDCNGGTLIYTGTGEGLTVLGENEYKSGTIRNCNVRFAHGSATSHWWSRIDFTVTHSSFQLGNGGVLLVNDLAHGGPGYTEQQHWSDIQWTVPANSCGVTFMEDPSIIGTDVGSFFYNRFEGHLDLMGNNSKGFCTTDVTAPPHVNSFGSTFLVHVNLEGAGDSVFYLAPLTQIMRGFVDLVGENDGGANYDIYLAGGGAVFTNFGQEYLFKVTRFYGANARTSINFAGGLDILANDVITGIGVVNETYEQGGIAAQLTSKTFSAGNTVHALARYSPCPAVNGWWQVGWRQTDNTWRDVEVAGRSGNPFTNTIYTDDCGGVGIGAGFGALPAGGGLRKPHVPLEVAGATLWDSGARLPSGTDLNTITQCGYYDVANAIHGPAGANSTIEVTLACGADPLYATQIAYNLLDHSGTSWIRNSLAGAWGPWLQNGGGVTTRVSIGSCVLTVTNGLITAHSGSGCP